MSTSRARFRRWTQASAFLAVLCAASLLLFHDSDPSAWDRTDAPVDHNTGSHHNDNGWLNKKHNIESREEGGDDDNNPKGCRSLLDPKIVNNKNRGPTSVPTSSTTIVPVTIRVNLGVNFRAQNCVDFYECDTDSGNGRYKRSEWKEDHHHGNATGSTILHQSTYTIELDGEVMLDGGQVRKFNFDDTAVNAELTAACGGGGGGGGGGGAGETFELHIIIKVRGGNPGARFAPSVITPSPANGCVMRDYSPSTGFGNLAEARLGYLSGSSAVATLETVDGDGVLCKYEVSAPAGAKNRDDGSASPVRFETAHYPEPPGSHPNPVSTNRRVTGISDRHTQSGVVNESVRNGYEAVVLNYDQPLVPPPERCPPARGDRRESTFAGRLVSDLTYDADRDDDIDKDDCVVYCPPSPPSSTDRAGEKVPPHVPKGNGVWLTGSALTDAIDDWCEREPVPPKEAAPGATTSSSALGTLDQRHCPAGASATDDTAEVNVAALLAADVADADRKVTFYPLGNDIQSTSSADARVVYGSAGGRSSWFSDVGQQFAATRCSDVAWA